MKQAEFKNLVEKAKKSVEYKNYLEIKNIVFKMLDNEPGGASPSKYWREELGGFEYILDASPLIIKNLRHHTYHLTGLREYDYRKHHAHSASKIEQRLRLLQSIDRHSLLIPESPKMGGFGYLIDDKLYNLDTLRFYECLIGLDQAGLLKQFREQRRRRSVLEIGSGWGGFAYQFKKLFPNSTYILLDFPAVIIFAATYLKTLFPKSKILICNGRQPLRLDSEKYDFIFLPYFSWGKFISLPPDLIVNMASFQEMTTKQVEAYVKYANEWGVKNIYSCNRDHSPNNPELSAVSSVLGKYYKTKHLDLTEIQTPTSNFRRLYLRLIKPFLAKRDPSSYQHTVGTIR